MKTQWQKHYTGSEHWQWAPSRETANGTGGGCELYGQRNTAAWPGAPFVAFNEDERGQS